MGRSITEEYLNQNMLKKNKSNEYTAYGSARKEFCDRHIGTTLREKNAASKNVMIPTQKCQHIQYISTLLVLVLV